MLEFKNKKFYVKVTVYILIALPIVLKQIFF